MSQKGLNSYFESYLSRKSFFTDKSVLQSSFIPEIVQHRDDHLKTIADILAPSLKGDKPSNLFIYGKPGSGKTVSVKHITSELSAISKKNNVPLKIFYVNCKLKKIADTEYRLLAHLSRECGKEIPVTGLPTEEIYNVFFKSVNLQKQVVLIILDEIDYLIKKAGDEALYNLIRVNESLENAKISIIGISNDLVVVENLDPRVRSSLSEEEVFFMPYNAFQLQAILADRAKKAFRENALEQGVIEKCAAYAAREHGDARRALELLRVASELSERKLLDKVTLEQVDAAVEKIDKDRIIDILTAQPKQVQATLFSISSARKNESTVFTGEVYEYYRKLCGKIGLSALSQRRVSDIISELDMLGIIKARTISKGRYGRMREISVDTMMFSNPRVQSMLTEALNL